MSKSKKSKPDMDINDLQLLSKIAKLFAFKSAIMKAYHDHPNQMDKAAADHDFVKEIAEIVDIYESKERTFTFKAVIVEENE